MPEKSKNDFIQPVPLGRIRDLNKEESDRLVELPFETLGGYEVLNSAAAAAVDMYNVRRKRFDLAPQRLERGDVRLVPASVYDADPFLKKHGENGALFHGLNRKCFIRFDDLEYQDPVYRMQTVYAITHELAHAAMEREGLDFPFENEAKASLFRLNEGFVDREARRAINERILPALYAAIELQGRDSYVQRIKPQIDGFSLEGQDVILTAPGRRPLSFSYLSEIRLVQFMEIRWPDVHDLLLRRAYRGEREGAIEDLGRAFGEKVCDQILSVQGKTREIIDILSRI